MERQKLMTPELGMTFDGVSAAHRRLQSIIRCDGDGYQTSANQKWKQIFNEDGIQVLIACRIHGSRDMQMEEHAHGLSDEWIVPIRGTVEVSGQTATRQRPMMIPAGVSHHAVASEDYLAVVVLAPPETAYGETTARE
jgi:quercetin dioxygenase-like cupin family protein